MHRFHLLVTAGAIASGSVFAADRSHLHGTYAFTGSSACVQDSASLGFNPNFTPKGPAIFFESAVMGTRTFEDNGTGTVTGTSVSAGAPPNAFASSTSLPSTSPTPSTPVARYRSLWCRARFPARS